LPGAEVELGQALPLGKGPGAGAEGVVDGVGGVGDGVIDVQRGGI
jgi:hypothetical protein